MAKSRKKKIVKIILHVFGVLLFVFATSYALLAAYGYQIDLLHQNIVKTSIIDLVGEYDDIQVYSNEEKVAGKLPYQIKNIKPGTYHLDIKSEEYVEWNRAVKVIEDFVTIVDDIYLIPKDLTEYITLNEYEFIYSDVVFNEQTLFFINKEKGVIRKMDIDNMEGDYVTISLLEPIEYLNSYAVGSRYLAFENEDTINLYDISSNSFIEILLPDKFEYFNLGYTSSLYGIYQNNNSLFSVDISGEGVFNEITLLQKDSEAEDIEVYSDGDSSFVKLDNQLYEYRDHLINIIASNVNYGPRISPRGDKIVYTNMSGEVYIYSFETQLNTLVGRFSKNVDYVSWFFDEKHIFILNDSNLLFCDLTMDNCPVIAEGVLPELIYIQQTKPLLTILNKEGIFRLNLDF